MTITVIGRAVRTSDGANRIELHPTAAMITITWACGAERFFYLRDLKKAVERIEMVADLGDWIGLRDSYDNAFAVKISADGQLTADERPTSYGGGACVDWRELRKAIKQTIKDAKAIESSPF